jgi:hypothetical protein
LWPPGGGAPTKTLVWVLIKLSYLYGCQYFETSCTIINLAFHH